MIGSWNVWSRSSVFSSSDASRFALATDAERKRLLEVVLGVERFDAAVEGCRDDLRASASTTAKLRHESLLQGERARGLRMQVETTRRALAAYAKEESVDLAALDDRVQRTRNMLLNFDRRILHRERSSAAIAKARDVANAKVAATSTALARAMGKQCIACGQAIAVDLQESARTAHEQALAAATEADNAHAAETRSATLDLAALRSERNELAEYATEDNALSSRVRGTRDERERLRRSIAKLEEEAASVEASIATHGEKIAAGGAAEAELKACERVLGTKGVRGHLLSRAVVGLEAVANMWLGRIAGPNVRVRIPHDDAELRFEVEGLNHEHGYKGASGGERRRVDVAMVLALGVVSAAAHGQGDGTLFMDEVFDTLDAEGVASVVDALTELAQTRCVFVVTHNAAMASALAPRAAMRLHVEAGALVER